MWELLFKVVNLLHRRATVAKVEKVIAIVVACNGCKTDRFAKVVIDQIVQW